MDMIAMRTYKGREGWVRRGQPLRGIESGRAKELIAGGLATPVEASSSPDEKAARAPDNKRGPTPRNKAAKVEAGGAGDA